MSKKEKETRIYDNSIVEVSSEIAEDKTKNPDRERMINILLDIFHNRGIDAIGV